MTNPNTGIKEVMLSKPLQCLLIAPFMTQHVQSVLMFHTVYHIHNDILKDGSNFFFLMSMCVKSASQNILGLEAYTLCENYISQFSWPGNRNKYPFLADTEGCSAWMLPYWGVYDGGTKGTAA